MRARAIENGCFVFAAAQGGKHENGRETFGHSLIVDPWGRILAEGGTEPGVIIAEIDPAEVAAARARIPSLHHGRRFELVEPMAEPTYLHAVRSAGMIRYALSCEQGHAFESWFQNSAAYDKQAKRELVTCPVCGSAKVEKAIMAPRLARADDRRSAAAVAHAADPGAAAAAPARPDAADPAGQSARRHDVAAGARAAPEAQGTARPRHQERQLCRPALSGGSAQDPLRRDRASLDLRRSIAG